MACFSSKISGNGEAPLLVMYARIVHVIRNRIETIGFRYNKLLIPFKCKNHLIVVCKSI